MKSAKEMREISGHSQAYERIEDAVEHAATDGRLHTDVSSFRRLYAWERKELESLGYKVEYNKYINRYHIRWDDS